MKRLFIASTLLFWAALAGLGLMAWRTPPTAPVPDTAGRISAAELARHATPQDCWMAIGGQVYDLSAYLPRHPSEPEVIEPWCGRDATQAYQTKLMGKPHSARADGLLPGYLRGPLAP